jgi:hypothetical protein
VKSHFFEAMREANLIQEGMIFSRYLIGKIPSHDLLCRYADAHSFVLITQTLSREDPLLKTVVRIPCLLPYLDAAAGVFSPHALLRKKLLLMLSILEACPDYTVFFSPDVSRTWPFFSNFFDLD